MIETSLRSGVRAPLDARALFEDSGVVYKAHILDISPRGVLIDELANYPRSEKVPIIFEIPTHPLFESSPTEQLRLMDKSSFPKRIIRAMAKTERRYPAEKDNLALGMSFQELSDEACIVIENYIQLFEKNLKYLLSLYENETKNPEYQRDLIRHLGLLLGYNEGNVQLLRHRALHDFQGFKKI